METHVDTDTDAAPRVAPRPRISWSQFGQDIRREIPELFDPFDAVAIREEMKSRGLPPSVLDDVLDSAISWSRSALDPNYQTTHRRTAAELAAMRAADAEFAIMEFSKFVDGLYDHFANMTKEQASREVGAVATILSGLKRGQRLGDAMTRDQFRARYFEIVPPPKGPKGK